MRFVFRALWSLWLLVFTLLIAAAQVGPDDAVANLAKWAPKFGIKTPPSWLTNPVADQWAAAVGVCGMLIGAGALLWLRKPWREGCRNRSSVLARTPGMIAPPPCIEVSFEQRSPYEVTDVRGERVLSTVHIGLRNSGASPLSNCKVIIERIAPIPPYPGGFPLTLEDAGFSLRHDEPEKLFAIASHWNHVDKFRFNSPTGAVSFAEQLMYIDDNVPRTLVVKIIATEHQRSASFKLWTDEERRLHLEFLGYVS